MQYKKILPICFVLIFQIVFQPSDANSGEFTLNEKVIGVPNLKTECTTASSQIKDYCKTQFAFTWTMYSGAKFGKFSVAKWSGTHEYASPTGICGLRFNDKHAIGIKDYIPGSEFTACYFSDGIALRVLAGMLEETRFEFYEPEFKGKNRDSDFYTSDIGLGWLGEKTLNNEIVIGAFLHHMAISSKRTSFKNSYYGHKTLAAKSPWSFAKVLAKFKYYDLIE